MNSLLQKGFSLIELMIALLLGSILLLGVTQMLVSSSTLGTTSNNLTVNQDRAKTVLDLLGSEVGRAGYKGCEKGGMLEWNGMNANDEDRFAFLPLPGTNIGINFVYGVDEGVANNDVTAGQELKAKDCFNRKIYFRKMVYQNCDKGLCIKGTSNPGTAYNLVDDSIADVKIDDIVFTLKNSESKFSQIKLSEVSTFTDEELKSLQQTAQLVTFFITVHTAAGEGTERLNAETTVKREYSATFRLRNL